MTLAGNARPRPEPGKATNARRIVQVLEFFDLWGRPATPKEIRAHYNWPQSSTSELLSVLVESGLLYRDAGSRFYPTPRAAMLSAGAQPKVARQGKMLALMTRLVERGGGSAMLIGRVGREAQIFSLAPSVRAGWRETPIPAGRKAPLHESAAGWLLLSTLGRARLRSVLHALRSEASPDRPLDLSAIESQVDACGQQGYVAGPAGFDTALDFCGVLIPGAPADQPLVIGLAYDHDKLSPSALTSVLKAEVRAWLGNAPVAAPHLASGSVAA